MCLRNTNSKTGKIEDMKNNLLKGCKGNVWSEYDYYADNYEDAHHKGWQSFISTAGTLIKWCYLSDILPEKGGDK